MKHIVKILIVVFFLFLFSMCSIFLEADPDNNPKGIFNSIWNEFNKTYALFDIKGIDWKLAYDTHAGNIYPGMSDKELFNVCSDMLKELDDAHVDLRSSFAFFNSGDRLGTSNIEPFSLEVVRSEYLNSDYVRTSDGMFLYGTFKDDPSIGYIFINGFHLGETGTGSQDWVRAIDGIISALTNTDALVLDIRGNRGGLVSNVDYFVSRFAAQQKDYVQVRTKNGPGRNDFSSPVNFSIKPSGTRYIKPVALLTNAQTVSAGEWAALALLTQDHIVHTGSTTNGAFSLSLQRFLVNGWSYTVSVQIVRDMQGICYEGTGISPESEHYMVNTAGNIQLGVDDQLEHALSKIADRLPVK